MGWVDGIVGWDGWDGWDGWIDGWHGWDRMDGRMDGVDGWMGLMDGTGQHGTGGAAGTPEKEK